MFLNGVPTGKEPILQLHKPILQVPQQVLSALFVVAAGTILPNIAVPPGEAVSDRTNSAPDSLSGFACLSPRSFYELKGERFERRKLKV